jgi:hypothetical protein
VCSSSSGRRRRLRNDIGTGATVGCPVCRRSEEMDSAGAGLLLLLAGGGSVIRKSQFFQLTERIHISHTIAAGSPESLIWP